jgi:hypothetical protein
MTIDFSDPDDHVETVHNDFYEDDDFSEANLDDDLSEAGTETSVSDYEGKVQEAPRKMFFGPKECRATFSQSTDQGTFVRVCGGKEGTCKRGHLAIPKAQEGYYETAASRKYVDGRLHTFQSTQEHRIELKEWKAQRDKRLADSVDFLATLDANKEGATHAQTQKMGDWKSSSAAETYKSEGSNVDPSRLPSRSSLKKAPPIRIRPSLRRPIH